MSQLVPEPRLEAAIAAAAVSCLRASGDFGADTPFALLGIDSLAAIEMTAALETSLGCALPPDLLFDCPDARSLAARIAQLRAGEVSVDPLAQLLDDAVLPDDVRVRCRQGQSTDLRCARRILLTGATGFLGGALLDELLHCTGADIVCLARGARAPIAPAGTGRDRVRMLVGDLARPQLGLAPAQWNDLAGTEAIVHCGASVNWVYGYAGLRAANVLGTLELLRLACRESIPFHFISSLSVCYSTDGPRAVDEQFDPLPHVRGVHLGYAQTKIAAEALVREAARRGLPARIYRPPLIAGDSRTGAYNREDLVSALVRGCVRMGTAPDLDWNLDCQPVDFVASAVVRLSGEAGPVFHLGHRKPRHWRECVLWMRMYGYPLRLVPYHTWLRQLDGETRAADDGASVHPLRPLRSFFLDRRDASGLTLPELYDEVHRAQASSDATRALLGDRTAESDLDAKLLDTYFSAFRASGELAAPQPSRCRSRRRTGHITLDGAFLSDILGRRVRRVSVLGSGSDHSIVNELTAWRSGRSCGLFHVRVEADRGPALEIRLKVKASDEDVIAVGESLASLVDADLGDTYGRWSDRLGFVESHHREIAIYQQVDSRFVDHAPALLGSIVDDERGIWAVALENVGEGTLMNAADDPSLWSAEHIAAAIDGLAELHAIWLDREAELRRAPWIGFVQSSGPMAEMQELWTALARHAAPAFSSWAHPDIGRVQRRLIDGIEQWWPSLEHGPRTLIHNDFNPRNLCLRRGSLLAYDWELATIGAPQRDLAEFLSFVLPSHVTSEELQRWINHHRQALEHQTGRSIETDLWQAGFRGALCDLLVNRLATYAVIHRVRRQAFLPRVVRTWWRLHELTSGERA